MNPRTRARLRAVAASALCATGTRWAVKRLRRWTHGGTDLLIVAYHLVTGEAPRREDGLLEAICVSAGTLKRQLEQLAREREIVPLDAALRMIRAPLDRRHTLGPTEVAVVTFDDGYEGVHRYALPVLEQLRIPAVAYVPTGLVGTSRRLLHDRIHACLVALEHSPSGERRPSGPCLAAVAAHQGATVVDTIDALIARLPHDELAALTCSLEQQLGLHQEDLPADTRIMSWDQLRDCASAGVEVGGHTVEHVALANVSPQRARAEIRGCREELVARLRAPARHFAYPNCYYTPRVREEVAAAGFVSSVTGSDARAAHGRDVLALPRRAVSEESTAGVLGRYSSAMAACHFDDLFHALRLRRRPTFELRDVPDAAEETGWSDPGLGRSPSSP